MSIGFVLSEQIAVNDAICFGVAAEQAGFERLWMADHFQPWTDLQGHPPQVWVALGALGQRTRRIPFGTSVTCPIYRYRTTAEAIRSLLDAGVREVYIHAAQPDQRRAIEFYGAEVLPRLHGLRARARGA